MTNTLQDQFTCRLRLPAPIAGKENIYIPVIAVFRRIQPSCVDAWLMPGGKARSDRELALDVLLEVRRGTNEVQSPGQKIDIPGLLEADQAASLLVSTFLANLPGQEVNSESVLTMQIWRNL